MTKDQWAKVKQIFGDSLDREPAEREAFIREAAGDDVDILPEILRLLAEHERDSGLLSQPALAGARAAGTPEPPRFGPSTLLARRFRIVRFIARGGMGEVYEAEDLELGERVALKAIRQRGAPDADLRAMFKREIQLARRVTHANVCRIFDLAHHEDPENGGTTLLLSMELIEGQTLAEHLRVNGPMPFREALPLIEDIAAGLQAVHDAGIIHGDLKPGNVMLVSRAGETAVHAMVMDFGMALPVAQSSKPASGSAPAAVSPSPSDGDDSPPTVTLLPQGWVLRGGTPDYFAPEQSQGAPATTATDVYAFALVIADMLGVPRPVRLKPEAERMPPRWSRILRRCLETDPGRRYERPSELASALRSSADGRPRALIAAALVVAALAIPSALYLTWQREPAGTSNRMLFEEGGAIVWCPSPDGRYLAASGEGGNLILREVKSGKIKILTHNAAVTPNQPGGAWGARFSPDGRHIAYNWWISRMESELRIIGTDGRGERTLLREFTGYAEVLDWSPDSRRFLVRLEMGERKPRVALISALDGSEAPLPDELSVAAGAIRFDADDRTFVYEVQGGQIHRRSIGGVESTLVAGPTNSRIIGWSPDRRRLVFSSDRAGRTGIWAVTVSSSGPEGEPQELLTDAGSQWEPLGVTGGGTLFYRNDADASDVYTARLDLAAGSTISPPRRVMERFVGSYFFPNWSEDGRELIFNSPSGLTIYQPETGAAREFRPDLSFFARPQWIGHGVAIMVVGGAKDGRVGHWRIDPRTGAATLFMSYQDLGASVEGVWSPDGKTHYNRYNKRRGIFSLNTETGERRTVYDPAPEENLGQENLALSPDGRYLVFQARRDTAGTASLMLVPAEGGPARTLLTVSRPEIFLYGACTWAPDSRRVLVARTKTVGHAPREQEVSEIWQVPLDGSPPTRIDFPAMRISSLRLNPDGKTIAFANQHFRSEIWTLQNFL